MVSPSSYALADLLADVQRSRFLPTRVRVRECWTESHRCSTFPTTIPSVASYAPGTV